MVSRFMLVLSSEAVASTWPEKNLFALDDSVWPLSPTFPSSRSSEEVLIFRFAMVSVVVEYGQSAERLLEKLDVRTEIFFET